MEIRRTLLIGIFGLVTLNILTAFGVVGLLMRMSPIIEDILKQNVQSLEAGENMLAIVALSTSEASAERITLFDAALRTAWENVTEVEERPVLSRVEAAKRAAFAGDPEARTELVGALRELAEINRRAMRSADEEAQRQGTAGAWFAVLVALLGVVFSTFMGRRLNRKLVEPLNQLLHVLQSYRAGDRHRRCTAAEVPPEFRMIFQSVNQLLDDEISKMANKNLP